MTALEKLEIQIRETPLPARLRLCSAMIGKMCAEGRPPRMSIPVQWNDEDVFISTTIADALKELDDDSVSSIITI
jgi:hypothetical protein